MKKIVFVFSVLMMSLLAVSCNNNDRIIDRYEEAINEGRYDDATSILYEIDEESLTKEQYMRILDISTGGAASKMTSTFWKSMHEMGGAMNEELTDERIDKYMEANEKVMEEALSAYDEAMEEMLDELPEY